MDEFKPETDLRPDTSDRRPSRARRPDSGLRFSISRQHIMLGLGIAVLLLLIISIGSALKAPVQNTATEIGVSREITLSEPSSLAGDGSAGVAGTKAASEAGNAQPGQPQNITVPPISATPTEAQPLSPPGGAQQRVELPGNMTDAFSSQQGQIDSLAQNMNGALSGLPTAPATVINGSSTKTAVRTLPNVTPPSVPSPPKEREKTGVKPVITSKPSSATTTLYTPSVSTKSSVVKDNSAAIKVAPGSHYTLQLSGASRPDTLNAFAKQQGLQNFMVYETKRDGKPWYVLVNGSYASSAEAKRAIATLPADVQAKKPWVRPVQQVKQDSQTRQ